jgi:hypothetical protein
MSRKCGSTCTEGAAVCRGAQNTVRGVCRECGKVRERSKVGKALQSVESTEWVS